MAEAEHATPWLRRRSTSCGGVRLEPGNQADDLAGADIERGDGRGARRRHRLHLWGQAEMEHGHAAPPFFFGLALSFSFIASSRARSGRVGQAAP